MLSPQITSAVRQRKWELNTVLEMFRSTQIDTQFMCQRTRAELRMTQYCDIFLPTTCVM